MNIQLNFINQSNDTGNTQVVIFQKNVAGFNELVVAWKVIQNLGPDDNHPFTYPMTMQVSASDSWGNYTPQFDAQPGQSFAVTRGPSGDHQIAPAGMATYPTEVQVRNQLPQDVINAGIYKNGALLATKTSVAPQQMAAFEFKPTIWIGAVSDVVQGEVMSSAAIEQVNSQLSLLGIASADIVMTGGGSGPNARPFRFRLQNVVSPDRRD